jgi:hypothetical protein
MNTTEIDHEALIDKYPDIIITGKRENLPTPIGKDVMEFNREVIIMTSPFIAQQLTVDREEICRCL